MCYTIFLVKFSINKMWGRTNKQGIAAKKQQQKKQADRLRGSKRFEYPKRKLDIEAAKELGIVWVQANPKGHTYTWFLRWRKICRETKMRVDPDGYRMIRTPSWWTDVVQASLSGRSRKKLIKNASISH